MSHPNPSLTLPHRASVKGSVHLTFAPTPVVGWNICLAEDEDLLHLNSGEERDDEANLQTRDNRSIGFERRRLRRRLAVPSGQIR
jgi:hypothetical protein